MAKQLSGFYYLRTSAQGSEPRKYLSLVGVLAAMAELVQLQRERGFVATAEADHKSTSRHPDGRIVQLWAENERGEIVG